MHKPLRTCVSCRITKPQKELTRLSLDKSNEVVIDKKQNMDGRGCYVCGEKCLDAAIGNNTLNRGFKKKVKTERLK